MTFLKVRFQSGWYFLRFCKSKFGSVFHIFGCCLFLRSFQLGLLKVGGGSLGGVPFVSTLFFGDSLGAFLASRERLLGVMFLVVVLI